MHHGEGLQLFNRMALSAPDLAGLPGAGAALRGHLHGRGSRGAELRPDRKLIRSMINGSTRADAAAGDGARLGRRSVRRHGLRRPPRREHLRAVSRALPGIHRRRRRSLPESRRHDAAHQCVPGDRRSQVPALARRLHGRVAGADEAQRRHHPELRRSGRHGSAGRSGDGGATPTAGGSARSIRSPAGAKIATGSRVRWSASPMRCS